MKYNVNNGFRSETNRKIKQQVRFLNNQRNLNGKISYSWEMITFPTTLNRS
jgi:hypothetical protein